MSIINLAGYRKNVERVTNQGSRGPSVILELEPYLRDQKLKNLSQRKNSFSDSVYHGWEFFFERNIELVIYEGNNVNAAAGEFEKMMRKKIERRPEDWLLLINDEHIPPGASSYFSVFTASPFIVKEDPFIELVLDAIERSYRHFDGYSIAMADVKPETKDQGIELYLSKIQNKLKKFERRQDIIGEFDRMKPWYTWFPGLLDFEEKHFTDVGRKLQSLLDFEIKDTISYILDQHEDKKIAIMLPLDNAGFLGHCKDDDQLPDMTIPENGLDRKRLEYFSQIDDPVKSSLGFKTIRSPKIAHQCFEDTIDRLLGADAIPYATEALSIAINKQDDGSVYSSLGKLISLSSREGNRRLFDIYKKQLRNFLTHPANFYGNIE